MRTFRYVSNSDVKRLLTPGIATRVAEETLLDHAKGDIDWAVPRQTDLWPELAETKYKVKGCVLRRHGVAGFRVTGLNRSDEGQRVAVTRPTKHVLLSDAATGEFFGIVDERWGYGLRTGAGAAIGLKYLRGPDADECAMVGTGHMAYGTLLALAEAIPLRRVRVWSRDPQRRAGFAERMARELGVDVVAAESAEACVRGAPMVVTATTAGEPFIQTDWFAPGVTVYVLGRLQEVETRAYREMTFMADDREQIRVCAEIKAWIAEGAYSDDWVEAELAEVVGGAHPGRSRADERILVRSQGLVTQDVAQAYYVYREAERLDAGVRLEDALVEQEGDGLF